MSPSYQPLEASEASWSPSRKRHRSPVGKPQMLGPEACVSQLLGGAAAVPRKKRKKKKRKGPEGMAMAIPQEQRQGSPWSPKSKKKGLSGLPAHPREEGDTQPQEDSQPVSSRKRKRRAAEGLCEEAGLLQGPPWHSCTSKGHGQHEDKAESPRKKKRKKRRPEAQQEEEENQHPEDPRSTKPSVTTGSELSVNSQLPGDRPGLGQAPLGPWNREREPDVVQELLKYSSDKAYGRQVLTWDGELSAVSRDAMEDSRLARTQTVVDEWDEEFDRGKEKKMKKFKKEKKRNFNAFQKLQSRRNFWSVTHPAKATSLSYRR